MSCDAFSVLVWGFSVATDASTGRPWEYNPAGVSVHKADVGVEQVPRPAQVRPGPGEWPRRVMHAARCS